MNSNSKSRNWKRIASVIVLVTTAALAVPFLPVAVTDVFAQTEMYGGESDADAPEAPQYNRPVTVEVTRALNRVVSQSRTVAGRVEPARTVDLAFQIPGQIIRLEVEPGDTIREGEVIALPLVDMTGDGIPDIVECVNIASGGIGLAASSCQIWGTTSNTPYSTSCAVASTSVVQ